MIEAVIWHDVECGSYDADLPLWRELAAAASGPVLDIGAGTGRVALDLASRGVEVTALDIDAALIGALAERAQAAGLTVVAEVADARDFELPAAFAAIIVPMQTIQLLGGPAGRAGLLRSARAHLSPGGLLAIAIADALDGFDADHTEPPLPDIREHDGIVFASRPVAVHERETAVRIERIREVVAVDGTRTLTPNVIDLDRLDPAMLEAEARAAGLAVSPRLAVPQTDEYVGSTVVVLR